MTKPQQLTFQLIDELIAYLYEKELPDGFVERTLSFGYEPEFEGKITPLYGITDEPQEPMS